MGALCIDADALYHELLASSADMLGELRSRFGGGVFRDGALDRKALGRIVFADASALAELNAITHRYITREMLSRLRAHAMGGGTLAAIDAVGIFEAGRGQALRRRVRHTRAGGARVERLIKREGITREYALERIRAQKKRRIL